MQITKLTYERLVPTYPYANFRVGGEISVDEELDLDQAWSQLVHYVTKLCRAEIARIDPFYALPEDERAAAAQANARRAAIPTESALSHGDLSQT